MSGLVVAVALAATASRLPAQTKATATNVPVIPHEAVPNFFKNPPGIYTGENMGIATNSKGNIYIYHRANETRLFEYTPQGVFIREIGRSNYGFAFAHSVRVDAQDNIWAVDEGTDMLIKFSPEGQVLMTIGRREDPVRDARQHAGRAARFHGRNAKYRFGRQTDVAFDQQGNIFVSDGYFDARVVKYDKNGRFVKAVGKRGSANLQFNTPHSIATDFQGNVYVGDRGNARVQVLDNDLNWKANYTERRQPVGGVRVGRSRTEEPRQAVSLRRRTRGRTARRPAGAEFTGEVYKMELDGTIVGKFGRAGKAPGEFATIHQMDCRDPERIYTAEINDWRSQKILLKPPATKTTSQGRSADDHASSLLSWHRRGAGRSAASLVGAERRCPRSPSTPTPICCKTPERRLRRRGRRRRRQFEGPDLRLHAHRPSLRHARRQPHVLARRLAAVPVRSQRQVRARAGARTSTASTPRSACASIRRTTSGPSTSAPTRS